jgi:hypothetical protein
MAYARPSVLIVAPNTGTKPWAIQSGASRKVNQKSRREPALCGDLMGPSELSSGWRLRLRITSSTFLRLSRIIFLKMLTILRFRCHFRGCSDRAHVKPQHHEEHLNPSVRWIIRLHSTVHHRIPPPCRHQPTSLSPSSLMWAGGPPSTT